jgi:hypothetical protein
LLHDAASMPGQHLERAEGVWGSVREEGNPFVGDSRRIGRCKLQFACPELQVNPAGPSKLRQLRFLAEEIAWKPAKIAFGGIFPALNEGNSARISRCPYQDTSR